MKQYCVYLIIFLLAVANASNKIHKHHAKFKIGSNSQSKNHKNQKNDESPSSANTSTTHDTSSAKKNTRSTSNKKDSDENLSPILSDWLQISSPQFKNPEKFPTLVLPNGKEASMKLEGLFRINDVYNKDNNDKNGPPTDHYFWFRLSGKNIYYSINKSDMNVLGSLHLKDVNDVTPMKGYSKEPTCFELTDALDSKWKLCAENQKVKNHWVCAIKKELNITDYNCEKLKLVDVDQEVTVLTKKVTQPIILIPLPQRMCNENWDYQRNGEDWECDCKEGKEQSPLDLPTKENAKASPVKPVFQYEEVKAKDTGENEQGEMKSDQDLKIMLENNVLKIKNKFFGKVVTLDGSVYAAEEIVFHTPSEHKINGKQYDMEMQVIHTGQTKGDIAKHVVVSFLFEKKPGVYNKFLDDVDFFNLPNPVNKERDILNNLYIPKVLYNSDSKDLPIMKPFAFYTYEGSLSAPPCTERTIHYVAAKPIPIGNIVVQLFQEATRMPDMMDAQGNVTVSTNLSANNRKVQPLNGRTVYYYNHVEYSGPEPPQRPQPQPVGHYEKVSKKMTEFFYVNSSKPSGLPGAFVVSESEAKGN